MKIIQQTIICVFGWVAYYALTYAATLVFGETSNFLFIRYSNPSKIEQSLIYGFFLIMALLMNFLSFSISLKLIAFPLLSHNNKMSTSPNLKHLFLEWFLFAFFILIFSSIPLMILGFFTISIDTHKIINFVWSTLVSISIYRNIVLGFVIKPTIQDNVITNENLNEISL